MFNLILKITFYAILLSFLTIACVHFLTWIKHGITAEEANCFLEWYKVFGTGFLLAFLGIMIPHVLADEKYRNERFQESKKYYSQAKTDIMYLREKVAQLDYDQAISKILEVHQKLHLAEIYPKLLKQHLKWLHPFEDTWVDRNYWDLFAIRASVNCSFRTWDKLTFEERYKIIKEAQDIIAKEFGFDNEDWYEKVYTPYFFRRWSQIKKRKRKEEKKLLPLLEKALSIR